MSDESKNDLAASAPLLLQRADRVLLRVSGRDPVRMIQGLITNDLAGAPPERAVYAAFLTPKGRMVADALLLRRGGAVLVQTAAAAEEALRAHLRKYVPPLFARVEDASGLALLGVYGAGTPELLTRALGTGSLPEGDVVAAQGPGGAELLVVPATDAPPAAGRDVIVPVDASGAVRDLLAGAGARAADLQALEPLRIEAGLPRWGAELDDSIIPLEAGLKERAISTTKGCYTGQEVIIRILHRGHVNRELRGLLLGDAAVPGSGAVLTLPGEDKSIGRVTSASASPRLGTIALAYVRREVEPGTRVQVGGGSAGTVAALPFG